MLPSVLAEQLQEGLRDYINTTFPMTNDIFRDSLDEFVRQKDTVFHEPYTAVRLPFRVSDRDTDCFKVIHPKFKPYIHQQKAYDRLRGDDGRSTLIATGTGSGKTECFLYPILDYCWRHMNEPGIKALIIYPMNALASDQAERIAKEIWNNADLKDNITVGMFVGGAHGSGKTTMGEKHVITDHDTMRNSPPDILLTNYKMLDYLLVRPRDAAIWKQNSYDTLKYIAVDELHTFDGAQGTDLACLLRRLKSRLGVQTGQLCCVGTSATMGGKDSAQSMLNFAQKVFGEQFEADAVITEDRLTVDEFLENHEEKYFDIPDDEKIETLSMLAANNQEPEYLTAAYEGWFGIKTDPETVMGAAFRIELAEQLLSHQFFRSLMEFTQGNYYQCEGIVQEMNGIQPEFSARNHPEIALDSFYALISHARILSGNELFPFLTVQTQVWFRELRRLLAKVDPEHVTYSLSTDLNDEQIKHYLPAVNCRDCGETGWVSLINEKMNLELRDLNTFYNLFFDRDRNAKIVMVFPHSHEDMPVNLHPGRLCPECLHLTVGQTDDHHCPNCKAETFEVGFTNELHKSNDQYVCPGCGSSRGIALIGLRAATGISAGLTQLYASPFNDDKKALAFCDSVQDAAHHAGFFNARTWRSGFRSAVQRYAEDAGEGFSLQQFIDGFVPYWQEKMGVDRYAGFFTPPDLTWMEGYEHLIEKGHLDHNERTGKLLEYLYKRLRYEIMLEYGAGGKIGRTLEKTGCSIPAFDTEMILKTAGLIQERIQNEIGVMRENDASSFAILVIGFLHLMRSNGAYADSIYRAFITEKGSTYLLSKKHYPWLPGLRSGRNTPKFISERSSLGKRRYDFDSIEGNTKYTVWIQDCARENLWGEQAAEIAEIVLVELEKAELVSLMLDEPGLKTWGLNKESLTVSTHVSQLICDCCGSHLPVAEENLDLWEGAPCLNRKCRGHYHSAKNENRNFYGNLYRFGDMERVNAREHSSILKREDREELEAEFKGKNRSKMPWTPNLLTCTPTLEMGIDIGDLSTVVLCSVPPEQSQFLQRIGRAGRKDGNALSMVAANARPHDSYFYADPMEMFSGNVPAPRVFLDAPSVLERQFTAFCMDSWIRTGVLEDVVPRTVGQCLPHLESRDESRFPFNFLKYVQNNRNRLLRQFEACFNNDNLQESSKQYLREYAEGKGLEKRAMYVQFLKVFQEQKQQRDALLEQIRELNALIKELKNKPKDSSFDEEIKSYQFDKYSLRKVLQELQGKYVFNFLSDEGLLPNYAFPESSVILKAILVRKSKDGLNDLEKKPDIFEYNRSASSALSEFAPSNSFYANGHKLKIDQIDMSMGEPEPWHLCPNCSHAEKVDPAHNTASCPNCHTPGWGDAGQIRNMLKVRMVYSNSKYEESMISDDSDDRMTVFYDRQTLVDIDDNTPKDAWQIGDDRTPFGYEYVQKAAIREINFGPKDFFGDKLRVAGIEESRKGFRICKYCGKVQENPLQEEHAPTCKVRKSPNDYTNPIENCLFLYRELETEILRILIPATSMDSTTRRLESFISAFKLGLDKHFGNVSHLRYCTMDVPVKEASYRKQMLVVYDSVPGGTGYLKQLMNNENAMIDVLEKALQAMKDCPVCSTDEERDGCYHCLYSYRQSSRLGLISRNSAMEMFESILSAKKQRKHLSSLDKIYFDSLIQSELEERFLTALEQINGFDIRVEQGIVHGKIGYDLKAGELHWKVEPQVNLGPSDGVIVPCCPDFVIWPVERERHHLPVAVFTDGFEFHKDIADEDSVKREAVRRSGKFRVWSLSYDDVMGNHSSITDYASPALDDKYLPSGVTYQKLSASIGSQKVNAAGMTPMQLLAQYLSMPDAEEAFMKTANAYAIGHLQPKRVNIQTDFMNWWNGAEKTFRIQRFDESEPRFGDTCFGFREPANTEAALLKIYSWIQVSEFKAKGNNAVPSVYAELDDRSEARTDIYKSEWNGFWHFWNLMQFSDRFMGVTAKGFDNFAYNIFIGKQRFTEDSMPAAHVWNLKPDDLLPEELSCAEQLMACGLSEPVFGYELTGTKGNVLAECSMAWESENIAVMMQYQEEENRDMFEQNGWIVYIYDPDDGNWCDELKRGE